MEDWIAFLMGMTIGGLLALPYAIQIKAIIKKIIKAIFKEQ